MSLINRHRLAVKAVAIELLTGLVGIGRGHFDKGESVADNIHRDNPPNHAKKILYGSILGAVGKVADQEFLGHMHTYAEVRIIIHRHSRVKEYFRTCRGGSGYGIRC